MVVEAPRILFLFKGGRRRRLESGRPGPREFFYGYDGLDGFQVELLEEEDLPAPLPQAIEAAATRLLHGLAGINAGSILRLAAVRARLNRCDCVVATTNSQALALALLRRLGVVRVPVLALAMGLLPLEAPPRHQAIYRRLLRHVALAPISLGELGSLHERLRPADMAYLPFGVDHCFWSPAEAAGDYVLSVGNDPQRDYATLAAAWKAEYPPLKIVTRLKVPDSAGRIEVLAGDWKAQVLSDEALRDLYRHARFVVIPVRQTIQPSGQSACLQAMACGKAVILSDILGLWDREGIGPACHLVEPGSVLALRQGIEHLLGRPEEVRSLGKTARATVEARFTVDIMAQALKDRLLGLAGARRVA